MIAIIAILAAILFPVFTRARESAKSTTCISNLRQIGMALGLYMADDDERYPDRRDLKTSLPGGYRPWTSWPPSDPRTGWAIVLLEPYKVPQRFECPSVAALFGNEPTVVQSIAPGRQASYWMWRFDRIDDPVPLDNLWGKTPEQAVEDLAASGNAQVGQPSSTADVELAVDPYFPRTIASGPPSLKGRSAHFGGRNRLFADLHVRFARDGRLNP